MDVEITFIITGIDIDIIQDVVNWLIPQSSGPVSFGYQLQAARWLVVSRQQKAIGARLCVNSGTERFHSQLLDTEVLHGVTRGNGPRLTGGPPFERLEVNEKQMSSIKIIPL